MKLITTLKSESSPSRESEIMLNASGRFEVYNSVSNSLSRGYPVKDYATRKAAEKYAKKFLEHNS